MYNTESYRRIRSYLENIPVIDTHEHFDGETPRINDPLKFLLGNYYSADYFIARQGMRTQPEGSANDIFRAIYARSRYTAYGRCLGITLKDLYGLEPDMSDEMLEQLGKKLEAKGDDYYEQIKRRCNIKASIVHRKGPDYDIVPFTDLIAGKKQPAPECYYALPIYPYCDLGSQSDILLRSAALGRTPVCLDDYLTAIDRYVAECVQFGIVAFKDITAYRRTLDFTHPTKAEAESVFNRMISRPRDTFGEEDRVPLGDYLMNHFLQLAAHYDLPVQFHTGHLAGNYNDIRQGNVILLQRMLELHRETRFDLLHINWPYMDDALFFGKNYPNIALNLCWTQAIDPVYIVEFLKRAVMSMPHSHIIAFGGDTRQPEWIYTYLKLSKDNVAQALSELVDSGWLSHDAACRMALDWFYNNPNEFYKLGLEKADL